jgi:hypothetical protein
LRQIEVNCKLTLTRVDEMVKDLETVSEEKLKIIGKSRELQNMLNEPTYNLQMIHDKVSEILDYSNLKSLTRSVVTGQPDRTVNIQRVESGGRVVTA